MIRVIDEVLPSAFDVRLDEETIQRAGRIRWQWTLLYNRVKSMPRTHATEAHMARCEEGIAIIDALLAANVTNH